MPDDGNLQRVRRGRLKYFQDNFDHDPPVEQAMEYLRVNHTGVAPDRLVIPAQAKSSDCTLRQTFKMYAIFTSTSQEWKAADW
jgi:hypothetical protein